MRTTFHKYINIYSFIFFVLYIFVTCTILDTQGFLLCARQARQVYRTENVRLSEHPVKPIMFRIRIKERLCILERNVAYYTSAHCGNYL